MRHSENLAELASALVDAQGEFEAVAKEASNPFFKSKYADLPSVVKAASPILARHRLSVTQLIGHDEGGDTLTTCLMHGSGQFVASTMRLQVVPDKEGKITPQAQGSATTYGRRYSYMAILGLVADEDDDGNAGSGTRTAPAARQRPGQVKTSGGTAKSRPPVPKNEGKATDSEPSPEGTVSDDMLAKLGALYRELGMKPDDLQAMLKEAGAEGKATKDLTSDQAQWVVVQLEALRDKGEESA